MASPIPNTEQGIEYWNTQPASLDGVLGGYGSGTLPRVDSLGSRLFLLNLYPELSTVTSSIKPLEETSRNGLRTRALDVGAGIGRVTADVLLHLIQDVVLLEPVAPFIQEAHTRALQSADNPKLPVSKRWTGLNDLSKSVTFIQGTLQAFDPSHPLGIEPPALTLLDRVGYQPPEGQIADIDTKFDVIWCQWCLGHLSDPDLVQFMIRSYAALRERGKSLIVVKENICSDSPEGGPRSSFDEEDSSLTRSDILWKSIFKQAKLTLVQEKVQEGLPEGLYVVKMYALR
ncbi:DUF858-domain-containing protein [Mycena floridula]|nr:DUF858-domain-containing protein [Mycena floridula]